MKGPVNFEVVVNLTTAQALGLSIPESVLAQATGGDRRENCSRREVQASVTSAFAPSGNPWLPGIHVQLVGATLQLDVPPIRLPNQAGVRSDGGRVPGQRKTVVRQRGRREDG